MTQLIMVAKFIPLLVPAVIVGELAAPSFTQGVLDVILGVIATALWKLVLQIGKILREIRTMREREPYIEHRLNDHRDRLHKLDNDKEETYYPQQ